MAGEKEPVQRGGRSLRYPDGSLGHTDEEKSEILANAWKQSFVPGTEASRLKAMLAEERAIPDYMSRWLCEFRSNLIKMRLADNA